jgi:hypothetical protein
MDFLGSESLKFLSPRGEWNSVLDNALSMALCALSTSCIGEWPGMEYFSVTLLDSY